MGIMSAGVHISRTLGGILTAGFLHDRQAVDIGPQGNAGTIAAAAEESNKTGLKTAVQNLDAQGLDFFLQESGGVMFLKAHLRILVQPMEILDHLGGKLFHQLPDFLAYFYQTEHLSL